MKVLYLTQNMWGEVLRAVKLQARGDVVIFDENLGNAVFISHEWVAKENPDPEFEQMRVLQDALRHILHNDGYVSPDWLTETAVPGAKGISHLELQARPLFLWYDYFSVPQQEPRSSSWDDSVSSLQADAINSILAYVAKCRFFIALCPTIGCPGQQKVLNAASWARRGWCRLERAARELSAHDTWILVQSSSCLEVVGAAVSFANASGAVGEGEFSVEEDRQKLVPVIKTIIRQKLMLSLQGRDLPAHRRQFNLQMVHLRGLETEPVCSLISDTSNLSMDDDPVTTFLCQNRFSKANERDSTGFRPLHYAALSGNVHVISGLLMLRADPMRRTAKPEPKLGVPPWMSPLDLAMLYRHNAAAQLLISARARLDGGYAPPMNFAATSNLGCLQVKICHFNCCVGLL